LYFIVFNKNKANICKYFSKNTFIMLIQFSVKNYKTFAEEVKLSMVASKDDTLKEKNVFSSGFGYDLLKCAVVYGANASGKSKLVEGMLFMKKFVENSANYQSNRKIDADPFKLSTVKEKEPSMFEVIFVYENEMYRYGFEVTTEKIISEWLFVRQNNGKPKETELFYREEQKFEYNKTKFKVKSLIDNDRVKENTLLLSKADVENEKTAKKVFHWITNNLNVLFASKEEGFVGYTVSKLQEDSNNKQQIIKFLDSADLGIEDLLPIFEDPEKLPKGLIEMLERKSDGKPIKVFSDVNTSRKKFNEYLEFVGNTTFSMEDDESQGTSKYFALSAPILDTLENGTTLFVDELDAKLHPNLVSKIVALFNSNITNPKNAQLIFNTHDTNLLSSGLFRRDQIWFTEKNHYGAADLYSLAEFKNIRKDDNYEKNYIAGKYGAIPFLGD
jgi:AAA15 family ATPase/GTPase